MQEANCERKMFERHGVDIAPKIMGGWLAQCADLLDPLYGSLKEILFESKVIGTDDTGVTPGAFGRTEADAEHPVIVYNCTTTRGRAGPEAFLKRVSRLLTSGCLGRI